MADESMQVVQASISDDIRAKTNDRRREEQAVSGIRYVIDGRVSRV